MVEHVASQRIENSVGDDFAYNRWAETVATGVATHRLPLENDHVLMLHLAEQPAYHTPLTITGAAKQIQTCLEPTTFDPRGGTIISNHLLFPAEQQRRPTLFLAKLWTKLAILYKRAEIPQPKEGYAPGDLHTLTMYSPVPICATMDGVDVKFEACVVKYVFPLESAWVHKSSNAATWNQKPTDEARIDERASLVASFVVPYAAPIPLRGLVDTGSGMSILTFSAFNRVAVQTGAMLKPYQIDLYAANGKTIRTMGMEECVRFQLGGYELKTNFVVVVDSKGVEDFLLGRNVLRACQVLVDLTSMKIVVRAPVQPVWHHANIHVGDPTLAVPVALDHNLVFNRSEAQL